ncbi:MAG: hypothetical protein K2Q22_03340 [Cytophagales bacterium]|nr:hypothetical protein [Cytophagales bacterium]
MGRLTKAKRFLVAFQIFPNTFIFQINKAFECPREKFPNQGNYKIYDGKEQVDKCCNVYFLLGEIDEGKQAGQRAKTINPPGYEIIVILEEYDQKCCNARNNVD